MDCRGGQIRGAGSGPPCSRLPRLPAQVSLVPREEGREAVGGIAAGARCSRHRNRCQGVPSHVQRRQGKVMVVMTVVVMVVVVVMNE